MRALFVCVGLMAFGASVEAQTAAPVRVVAPGTGRATGTGTTAGAGTTPGAGKAAGAGTTAGAGRAAGAGKAGLPPLWIGVFDPMLPAHAPWGNARLTPVAHGGAVRVLTPEAGAAASGEVVIVHPLLGKTAVGTVAQGSVTLSEFAFDQRDGDDGVLVVPAGTKIALVAPGKADVAAIQATLVRTDALAGVRRALAGLEVAGVDLDGDGKADVVATYGCAAWFDGACQSRGQFVLRRKGARWAIVE